MEHGRMLLIYGMQNRAEENKLYTLYQENVSLKEENKLVSFELKDCYFRVHRRFNHKLAALRISL